MVSHCLDNFVANGFCSEDWWEANYWCCERGQTEVKIWVAVGYISSDRCRRRERKRKDEKEKYEGLKETREIERWYHSLVADTRGENPTLLVPVSCTYTQAKTLTVHTVVIEKTQCYHFLESWIWPLCCRREIPAVTSHAEPLSGKTTSSLSWLGSMGFIWCSNNMCTACKWWGNICISFHYICAFCVCAYMWRC